MHEASAASARPAGLDVDPPLVAGLGGIGGAAVLALAGGGLTALALTDGGLVQPDDLDRSPLFREADVGTPRTDAGRAQLVRLFPGLRVEVVRPYDLARCARAGVVVGAAEEPLELLAVHDAAIGGGRPFVCAGLLRYTVQLLTVLPGATACLRCLFEEGPPPGAVPAIAAVGALATLAAFAGGLAAAEAARLLRGDAAAYAGQQLVYEARSASCRRVRLHRRPGCPVCGALEAAA